MLFNPKGTSQAVVRMVQVTCLMLILLMTGCVAPEAPTPASSNAADVDPAEAEAAIRTLIDEQETAWNSGDINTFMDGYARTDSLRFASGGSVHTGWQMTLDRYHRAYPDRATMGFLVHPARCPHPLATLCARLWRLATGSGRRSAVRSVHTPVRAPPGRLAHHRRPYV